MNALKFQQEVLKTYVLKPDNKSACWTRKGKDQVALFLNRHVGIFLPNEEMMLDPAKIPEIPAESGAKIVDPVLRIGVEAHRLEPTEEYRFTSGNKKIRIYKARAWQTGIDQSLLKYFDPFTMRLYQVKEYDVILITEKTKGYEDPVGLVLPVHI